MLSCKIPIHWRVCISFGLHKWARALFCYNPRINSQSTRLKPNELGRRVRTGSYTLGSVWWGLQTLTWFSKANRTSDSFLITYPAFLLSCFLLPYHRPIAGEKQWKAFGSSVVLVELAGVDGATPPIPAKKFTLLGVLHSVWELIQYSCVGLFYCFCCCFWYFLLLLLGLYFFSCLFAYSTGLGRRKEQEYLLPGNYCNWAHEK